MKFRFFRSETLIALITIALLTVLTHGLRLANLGYYRDDWYLLWNGYVKGYESIAPIFQGDRPFMGIIYSWAYRFLGDEAINWHMYALILKLGGALSFFWLLRMIWPKRYFETTAAVLLFVVYPGFLQQPNANTFQNHLFGYFLAILSIALTIRVIQTPKRWVKILLSILAILFQLIYLNIYEYMIGLEGVRLLFIWYVTFRDNQDAPNVKIKSVIKRWIIYAPVIIWVIYWRIFIFESTRQAMNVGAILANYSGSRISGLFYYIVDISVDMIEALFFAWFVPLYGFLRSSTYRHIGMSVLYALAAVGLFGIYYIVFRRKKLVQENQGTQNYSKLILWMGLFATVVTIVPVILAGRNIYFANQFDRYTLQATIGIALFFVGFIFYGFRSSFSVLVLIVLIGFGVVTHYHNITFHQEFWQVQRDLWWQLSWRAPDIADDTVLMTMLPPRYRLAESYEVWGPANIIYSPESDSLNIQAEVLSRETAQKVLRGADDEREQRGAVIVRDFKNVLLASMPSTLSCVNIIDGQKYELSQKEDLLVVQVAPYSQIDRIDPDAVQKNPPVSIFGEEPDHTWCFYYQKIALARQQADWARVAILADEAFEYGFKPLDLYEWMPVYEGYANINRKKEARQISRILRSDKDLQYHLCTQLEAQSDIPVDYDFEFIYGELCLTK